MKKFILIPSVLLVLVLGLAGCSVAAAKTTSSASLTTVPVTSSPAEATTAPSIAPQVIKVGTMGTYEPFTYVDDAGNLTGYDIEVLRLIEKADPTLKFDFVTGPWDSLFPGLDADKFQVLANQITSNPDRAAKYLLTDSSYALCVSQLIVKTGRTDIQSLNDLKGKKIGTTVGDSFTRVLEDWNAANGNILEIVYYEEDITTILQDIVNGRIDATLNDPIMAAAKAKAQNLAVEPVGERVNAEPTYFILKQDAAGETLKVKLDAALTKIKEDGSLSKLSIDFFGVDYSK